MQEASYGHGALAFSGVSPGCDGLSLGLGMCRCRHRASVPRRPNCGGRADIGTPNAAPEKKQRQGELRGHKSILFSCIPPTTMFRLVGTSSFLTVHPSCTARCLRVLGESRRRRAWNGGRPRPQGRLRKHRIHCKGRDNNPKPSSLSVAIH